MPLYEYKCRSCGKTFEVIRKFADEPLKTHPECGGEVDMLFSAPAFHLKGTGWYATDYAKKNGSGDKSEEAKPKSDSGSESKPSEVKSEGDKSASDSSKADTKKDQASRPDKSSSSSSTDSKATTSESTSKPAAKPE